MKIKQNDYELFTKIGNLFPDPLEYGIITSICGASSELLSILQTIKGFDITSLELAYYKRSHGKTVSSLVDFLLENYGLISVDDYYLPNTSITTALTKTILVKYLDKWLKLLNTLTIKYEALSPYNMRVEDNLTKDHLTSKDTSKSIGSSKDSDNSNYYGFNSQESVPIDESGSQSSSQDDRTANYERDATRSREITRKGNIGNKTNQELINEERKLDMWIFYDEMFKDIDRVLANPMWED